jgi:hypothetical protein
MAKKQTQGNVPDIVSRAKIRPRVVSALRRAAIASQADPAKIVELVNGEEALTLADDLSLGDDMRSRLKADYNAIGESYNPDGRRSIGPLAARNCEKVSDAIDLTYRRANGRN